MKMSDMTTFVGAQGKGRLTLTDVVYSVCSIPSQASALALGQASYSRIVQFVTTYMSGYWHCTECPFPCRSMHAVIRVMMRPKNYG